MEIWRGGGHSTPAEDPARIEAEGWDGQMFMDSQSLCADPYVVMGAWAARTGRLKLSTGVTNPLTRHPAVTAAGAATVQMLSNGRAVLGIGRGDSALAYLGHAPVGLPAFARALHDLQTLLRGGEIAFAGRGAQADAPGLDQMSLGARPDAMALRWLPKNLPKVPLDVAATGPKVIEMAAAIAERVTFSVGANPERLAWALELARTAHARAGRDEKISYGAQISVFCHRDAAMALETAAGMVAPLARFQVIQGQARGPQSEADRENYALIRKNYDMTKHGRVSVEKRLVQGALTPEFVQGFAVVGTPDTCLARLRDLCRQGLERLVIVGPGFYPASWGEDRDLFAREVLPALRQP